MKSKNIVVIISLIFLFIAAFDGIAAQETHRAAAPLYRDPITDGAADPVVFWNRGEKNWWMLYTQRRANLDAANVAYCYGTAIGVAVSEDNGQTWVYKGTLGLEFEPGHNTFWAPDVVYDKGVYHLFAAYIRGVRNHWGGQAHIAHYTSTNARDWNFEELLKLSSDDVIDATVFQMPDGQWRMWYKDSSRGSITMTADSSDLKTWTLKDEPAIGGSAHEGPKVFRFGGYYWMLTDEWAGMRVYRSEDAEKWEKQGRILEGASSRSEDGPSGAHGDVVVVGDKAYVFYFTHPMRKSHGEAPADENGVVPYALRRSSIQAAQLVIKDGTLVCERENFDFWLPELKEPAAAAGQSSDDNRVTSGNPIIKGWYADPEALIFGKTYWIYPTTSDAYEKQTYFDCFSSQDLITWTRHERILDAERVKWAKRAMWAPSVIENANRYYFFFSANDVHEGEIGGIGVAVSDKPEGKFKDLLGKPLIGEIINGAQPIDQFVFRDEDGTFYMYYGGWRHCNVVKLSRDFRSLVPFEDGQIYKEITPEQYVEGPTMFKRGGKYYFMWSEGGWGGPDYSVAYAIADGPLGPFKRIGKILQQDPQVATGAGHHSVIQVPGTNNWYIVYHRRPLTETEANHRVVCIDKMEFDGQEMILPVKITNEGIEALRIP